MNLPKLSDFDFRGKKVIVRCDFDVPLGGAQSSENREHRKVEDDSRIRESLLTIQYLLDHAARLILMGHLGRPEGVVVEELKMIPVAQKLDELLNLKIRNQRLQPMIKVGNFDGYPINENIILLENLRFYPDEENNNPRFAEELASLGDFYVNEAFASSHRAHASIVGVPKLLPHCAGFHFTKEVDNLSRALENPKKPLVFIIGGAKPETKLPMVAEFAKKADFVLVGGTLPEYQKTILPDSGQDIKNQNPEQNIKYAQLTDDGFDINKQSIKEFCEIINTSGMVVWNGPMGKFEEERWEAGTKQIALSVAGSSGYKLVGGGDTIAALTKFNLIDKMDYISTAGGAMLEFLEKGTLPGITALI